MTATAFLDKALTRALAPPPVLTVSEWADRERFLTSKSSAEPGRWRTSRTPYLKEIMDCLSPMNPVERVAVMAGAQIGKTECGNNWIGYVIDQAPAPMLMVQPTLDMAKKVSKQRITPMIESSPALRNKIAEPRERDSGNTTFVKEIKGGGGLLMLTGANAASGLRSMPVRDLFLDEVDGYPGDVEGEGDPVSLAEKRTATFKRRRKVMLTSTPTLKGLSRIEKEFLASDRRRYYLPCPECGHMDFLTWRGEDRVTKVEGEHHRIEWDGENTSSAWMVCGGCQARVPERHKTRMLAQGEWRATARGNGTAGFHISALYSPLGWKSWGDCAAEFVDAKGDPFRLRTWVNTVLGETWEESGDNVDPDGILARAARDGEFAAEVPAGVGMLTAGVDVQGDRLEAIVVGWGAQERSWLIATTVLIGNPSEEKVWNELTAFICAQYTHESGRQLPIDCTAVDSGGHHTEQVYRYCKAMESRNVFAVKGASIHGAPLVNRPTNSNRYRAHLFTVGTDTAKDMIYARLRIREPGPGYIRHPIWIDREYVDQLCAETAVPKYVKGKGATREYVKTRERNEALDLWVYSLAALHVMGIGYIKALGERAEHWATPPSEDQPVRTVMRREERGWVDGWR